MSDVVDELFGPPRPSIAVHATAAAEARAAAQPELEDQLWGDPTAFEFFQLVRLLERLYPNRDPVGRFGDPAREAVRFVGNPSMAYPASEVQGLEERPGEPPRMMVNFLGLTGTVGALPLAFSALVLERLRARDTALRDFLDIFNHRAVSLFYRAWQKYRFAITHERDGADPLTQHVLDLVGLGTSGLQGRMPLPDEVMVSYAGLLALRPRPAVALEQLLGDYFGVPAVVEQFVGAWYPIEDSAQVRLDDDSPASQESNRLGLGAVAGDEVWDLQSRARIRLGPLRRAEYERFLPTGDAYEPLRALVRFFGGGQVDFELQLVLARDEIPGCVLGAPDGTVAPLGWTTWLHTRPAAGDADETVLAL